MFGTPPTCAPYAHSARTIRTTIPDIPERHPMFLDVHQYTTTTSRVLHDKQQFTWQCLFLRVRGHYGRCARSRVRPGQLAGVLAARYHRRGHPHQQFLLQDDLIMDMDQGRRRGCARSRSRPRTRARSLSLASQHDPARLSPTLPTETRALHSKLSPTIFHPHDFTNSTNKGHTINYYCLFIIYQVYYLR